MLCARFFIVVTAAIIGSRVTFSFENPFDSPIFPPNILDKASNVYKGRTKIPPILWIAVVNATEAKTWPHIMTEMKINPKWTIRVEDNNSKDKFMEDNFANTSLLWAYKNINPVVGGAAKADIWRYAALYLIGGVYIDADSFLSKSLDDVILPSDDMIITFELNNYEGDWCYSPNSKLSTILTVRQHPISTKLNLFHGRNILNWCIMSNPFHKFLKKTLENFVHLAKLEFFGLGAVKKQKYDQFSKHVYCTTGPSLFTASLREAVIELNERISSGQNTTSYLEPSGYRLASRDFIREGGVFKVINTVNEDKNHYTKVTNHHHFLLQYAPQEESIKAIKAFVTDKDMEGSLIMGRFQKNVYVLEKGEKRPINSMDILLGLNYTLSQIVHLSDFVISHIPLGREMAL